MSLAAKKMASNINMGAFAKAKELKSRILFTLFVLIIYRVGTYIPLPNIDSSILGSIVEQNAGGILGMFNVFSGGALGRMSVFALNIMPYITASIIVQLMTVISKNLANLKKEGESGRQKIQQYTRYLTVMLTAFQGFGIAVGLESMSSNLGNLVVDPGLIFRLTTAITLVGGTLLVMWLGEQITARGIGNGVSLIIFAGIVAELPSALASFFELGRTGSISTLLIFLILILAVGLVALIVFMERAQRRLIVQYPKRQKGNKIYGGESSHIPLKINTAGVIPPIFASAVLLFPATISGFGVTNPNNEILNLVVRFLSRGEPLYIGLYIAIIIFFSFFYTATVFNPEETADNLKKNGGFIPGRRPGKHTSEYLDYVLTRLTVVGSLYLSAVCILPEILISKYSVPFYLGGTSLLIVVNVIMDTLGQVQTHMLAHQYEGMMKNIKIRGKR